jgi:hypothetical protein
MTVFRTDFCWRLPPEPSSVQRYAELIAERSGLPCHCRISTASRAAVEASLAFPRVTTNNLITLSAAGNELEFAPIPFFWLHAIAGIRALGGDVYNSAPPVASKQNAPRWQDLKWTDRARIMLGGGPWVKVTTRV